MIKRDRMREIEIEIYRELERVRVSEIELEGGKVRERRERS